jgi:hypothetical protein
MTHDDQDLLDLLTFELKFLEDGGYGRSPHTPWRRQRAFEDSLTCLNFGDPARPHPCGECLLLRFVPIELRDQQSSCRLIPLTPKGETIDYFYRCGTQIELEEALAGWLRKEISNLREGPEDEKKLERAQANSPAAVAGACGKLVLPRQFPPRERELPGGACTVRPGSHGSRGGPDSRR